MRSELVIIGGVDLEEVRENVRVLESCVAQMLGGEAADFSLLRDIAYTSGLAANDALVRCAVVAEDLDDLLRKLGALERRLKSGDPRSMPGKGIFTPTNMCPAPGRTAFVFSGEGSQYSEMLRDVCENFPVCRAAFEDADAAASLAGAELLPSAAIFPESAANGAKLETDVSLLLQAIIAANSALAGFFKQIGIVPDAVVGAGIGTFSALECAEAINFASREERRAALAHGYALIKTFSASSSARKFRSFSVSGIIDTELFAALKDFIVLGAAPGLNPEHAQVVVTRYFTPDFTTICCVANVAGAVARTLTANGATVREIPLTQPFHTPWMSGALPALHAFFAEITKKSASEIPIYSCAAAEPFPENEPLAAGAALQWLNPIRFNETINRMHDDGFRVFVELGARGSLTTGIDLILRHRPHLALAANRIHRPDLQQLNHTLAALVSHGMSIDVEALHRDRGSRRLDFERALVRRKSPRQEELPSAARECDLPPTFMPQPKTAIAAAPSLVPPTFMPQPKTAIAAAPSLVPPTFSAPEVPKSESSLAPLLESAELVNFSPREKVEVRLAVSSLTDPIFANCTLSTPHDSADSASLRPLTLVPLTLLLELMAEVAWKLAPTLRVVAAEDVLLETPFILQHLPPTLLIRAAVRESGTIAAEIFACNSRAARDEGECLRLASASFTFAADFLPAPPTCALAPLDAPRFVDLRAADIYPARLRHGVAWQNLPEVSALAANGARAKCAVLPRSRLIKSAAKPNFALDPVLLNAAESLLAIWHGATSGAAICVGTRIRRLECYAPPPPEWTALSLAINSEYASPFACADADFIADDGKVLFRINGYQAHMTPISESFAAFLADPVKNYFTAVIPSDSMPALPADVVCCVAPVENEEFSRERAELWLQTLAHAALSTFELGKWRELSGSVGRRTEWLLGRVGAKEALRRSLMAQLGKEFAAADIRVEADKAGKPSPAGVWRELVDFQMDISITHTPGKILAAAAPKVTLGIDVERCDRPLTDEFVAGAFTAEEEEIAAESGEAAIALLRFWCAKEALGKTLGVGLKYGAADLCARALAKDGRVSIQPTKLWLQVFPKLRGKTFTVHTCIFEELVLAVCTI